NQSVFEICSGDRKCMISIYRHPTAIVENHLQIVDVKAWDVDFKYCIPFCARPWIKWRLNELQRHAIIINGKREAAPAREHVGRGPHGRLRKTKPGASRNIGSSEAWRTERLRAACILEFGGRRCSHYRPRRRHNGWPHISFRISGAGT